MKKIICTIILATTFAVHIKAQVPKQNIEWAIHLAEDSRTCPIRTISDSSGNIYTIARHQRFGFYVNTQNYITKINTDGDILWTKNIHNINITTGSTNPSVIYVHDLAVDSEDNLYITGDFRRTADFDPGPGTYQLTTGTYPSGFYTYYRKEGFIVKLNAEGDFVWAEKYGVSSGQNNIRIHSLTADNEGFLYALGDRTSGDITGVLYKINASNGNVVWSKNSLQPTSAPIVLDQTNHLLLTGYFSGTFDFDPDTTSFLLTSAGSNDAFILKLDAEGGFVWASQFGGSGDDRANALVTDSDGNVFVTGFYSGTVTTSVNGTNTTLPSAIGTDGFIAKLNASDGDFLWVSSFGNDPGYVGTKDDAGYGIALDHSEDVYVTGVAHLNYTWGITNHGQQFDNANISGHKRTDIAIFKLNSTEGTFSWIDIIGGSGRDYGLDIVLDKHYNIFVAGLYNDQIYYSNTVAPNDSVVDFDASPHSSHYLAGDSTQLANRFLMKMSLRSIVHITEEICSGDSYEFNDTILYDTGTYYDTLINVAGYDSIITLNLTVNYPTAGIDTIMACDSYTWIDGNTYNSNNNTATHTLTNVAGCDSVATLDLIINESPTTIDTHIVCHGSTFTWVDGNTYAAGTNTPTYTIPNGSVHGCDSTITLNLIFDSAITGIDTQTACNSYTWIDGNTYTTSTNSIVHTLTATNGCDSVVTLNLTINHSTDSTITYQGVSGDGYAINVNGTVYNENNPTGTEILMNAAGCDSIVTINLLYPVAIEDLNGINEMTIFPNPFSSTVKVHFTDTQAGQLKLTLLDILSREITSKIYTTQSGKNELSLEIPEHVGAGNMILLIERNGKIYTQKLVKD